MAVEAGNFYVKERGPFTTSSQVVQVLPNELGYRADGPFMHHTITFTGFTGTPTITIQGRAPDVDGALTWAVIGTVVIGTNDAFVVDPRTIGVFTGFRFSATGGDEGDVYFRSTLVGI